MPVQHDTLPQVTEHGQGRKKKRTEKVGARDADGAVGLRSFDHKMRRRLSSYATIRHLRAHHEARASLSMELDDDVTINIHVSKKI